MALGGVFIQLPFKLYEWKRSEDVLRLAICVLNGTLGRPRFVLMPALANEPGST